MNRQEVEDLRPVWEQWTNGLDTDIDYYLQNLESDRTILHPYVVSVWKGEVPLALQVAQVRRRTASSMVAMVRIQGPSVKLLETVPRGRLGAPSPELDRLLVRQLSKALQNEADMLCFRRLPPESQLFREVWQMPGMLIRKRVPHIFSYSRLALPERVKTGSPVFSGKMLREARRKTSNLQRAFPGKVSLSCFSHSSELEAGLRDAETVSVSTWQHSLGIGFTDTLPTYAAYRLFARKGWLRIFILYVDGQPCAYLLGQLYRATFHCQRAGYHPDFARFSVGSVLTAWAFENLAAAGAQLVDLGEGGEEHNRRLGCEKCDEGTVHIYAPTLRGFWLNLFFGATTLIRASGRKTRSRLRLNWMARICRQFLIARRTADCPSLQDTVATVPNGNSGRLS
jgi:hypothetical protein